MVVPRAMSGCPDFVGGGFLRWTFLDVSAERLGRIGPRQTRMEGI